MKNIEEESRIGQKHVSFKMTITHKAEKKIREACSIINNLEWSGVLFYKVEGQFEDKSLHVIVIDLFPMDIGQSTYTEFIMSPDVTAYMVDNPELLQPGVYQGLIHSHQSFGTFFSGTDVATLKELGAEMPHFVSLIVNNAGDYTAAITRRLEPKTVIKRSYVYPTFENKSVTGEDTTEVNDFQLEYFYFDIKKEGLVDTSISDRFNEIREMKKAQELNVKPKSLVSNEFDDWKSEYKTVDKLFPEKYSHNSISAYETEKSRYSVKNEPEVASDDETVYYDKYVVNKDNLQYMLLQLLTGSALIPNSSKLDIGKWVKSMPKLYENRFADFLTFKQFASTFVDYLIEELSDEELYEQVNEDDSTYMAVISYYLLQELKKLNPSNKYIDEYMKLLESYIL